MKPLRVRHTLRCNLMLSRPPSGVYNNTSFYSSTTTELLWANGRGRPRPINSKICNVSVNLLVGDRRICSVFIHVFRVAEIDA